jgi:hypothetical protein
MGNFVGDYVVTEMFMTKLLFRLTEKFDTTTIIKYEILGFHGGEDSSRGLLGCDAV